MVAHWSCPVPQTCERKRCQRWPLALLREIRLAFLQRLDLYDQTSWCSRHHKAAVVKTVLPQIPENKILQLRQSQTGEICRQFLGSNLQKKG